VSGGCAGSAPFRYASLQCCLSTAILLAEGNRGAKNAGTMRDM
jgi:hypothetical protein